MGRKVNRFQHGWRLVVLALLVGFAYSNTLHAPFIFDDQARIVDNDAIRQAWPPSNAMQDTNRPFGVLTFAWNYSLGRLDPFGYHLANIVIHLGCSFSLYFLVFLAARPFAARTTEHNIAPSSAAWLAFFVAIIWASHPLNTQAVTYTVQRLESLMAMFYLLALVLFAFAFRCQHSRSVRCVSASLSIAASALAMGCKEVAVTIPVAVLWFDRVFVAEGWREILRRRWGYYLGLCCSWGVLAWAMLHYTADYSSGLLLSVEGLTPWTYLTNQSAVITHYLKLSFWPVDQCFFYDWPIERDLARLLPFLIFIGGCLIASLWLLLRQPRLGFAAGMFFLVLSPTSSVVPIGDLAFEHRMYLPLAACVAFVIGTALALSKRLGKQLTSRSEQSSFWPSPYLVGPMCLLAIVLATLTYQRNSLFRDPIQLWDQTVQVAPANHKAWHNLGMAYRDAEDHAHATESFAKVVGLLEAKNGQGEARQQADALATYGASLRRQGKLDESEKQLRRALELHPENFLAARNLGSVLLSSGQPDAAVAYLELALAASPADVPLQLDMGAAAAATGNFHLAIRMSEQVLQVAPESAEAHVNMACGLGGLGLTEKAITFCQKALKLDPNLPNAHGTLALLLAASDPAEAIKHLELAAGLEPNQGMYDAALGDQHLREGDLPAASQWYQRALAKEPNNVEAHLGLFEVFQSQGNRSQAIEHLRLAAALRPQWPELAQQLKALTDKE